MDRSIRSSAKALIIRDGKMAAVKIAEGAEEWYIMPGGGQEAGEALPQAACREAAEELGIKIEVDDLAFVIEGPHGEAFHRIDHVFLCRYLGEAEGAASHWDTNQVGCDWLDIAALNTAPLYPSKLRRAIMSLYEGKPHPVYLGCEEIGDPEVTD